MAWGRSHPNGATYVGQWKDDFPNGQGVETFADGTTLIGRWENGEFVGE